MTVRVAAAAYPLTPGAGDTFRVISETMPLATSDEPQAFNGLAGHSGTGQRFAAHTDAPPAPTPHDRRGRADVGG